MARAPEPELSDDLPASLKFLRILVTVLTVVMIAGVITIITLLVIRLNGETRVALVLPQDYALPGGVQAQGFSILDDRIIVIGDDRVIRIFDIESRDMTQTMTIE